MVDFIGLVKDKGFARLISTICATGGGAVKYAEHAEKVGTILLLKSGYQYFS